MLLISVGSFQPVLYRIVSGESGDPVTRKRLGKCFQRGLLWKGSLCEVFRVPQREMKHHRYNVMAVLSFSGSKGFGLGQ